MSLRRLLLSLPFVAFLIVACGSRADLTDPDQVVLPDGGLPDGVTPPPTTCGDGTCEANESCTTCPEDCGFCQTCGDGTCETTETCLSCPIDCGKCPTCGDGICEAVEDCTTCPEDCGQCASCGDGTCGPNEDCNNCPQDCGKCPGCGDGICSGTENCISCPADCGLCSVCGNNKCEPPYETCTNCPQDCGQCQTVNTCFETLTCALKCVDIQANPPTFSLSCVANCLAEGCANAQYFADQAVDCAVTAAIGGCGGDFNCIQKQCSSQIAACLGSSCQ